MDNREDPPPKRPVRRALTRAVMHPLGHVAALVSLHVAAVTLIEVGVIVIEKTPLKDLLLH